MKSPLKRQLREKHLM